MGLTLPDSFGVFPEGARLVPDKRFVYLTPQQRRQWLELTAPTHFEPPNGTRCTLNQPYGPHPKQRLDLYLPDSISNAAPVIFYIHGGYWTVGERGSSYINCCFHCLRHGFAIIGVDYRLLPETGYPENLGDVCAALRWAREHAGSCGLDPDRFGIIGDSAGGYLALMCALTCHGQIQAVCAQFAPTSLLPRDEDEMFLASGLPRQAPPTVPSLYSTLFGDDSEQTLRRLSPTSLIGPGMPPLFLQHGTCDTIFPYQMAVRFVERARELCPDCCAEYKLYDGFVHSDPRFLSPAVQCDVLRFFKAYLS